MLLAALTLGCGPSLPPASQAGDVIHGHLAALAPAGLESGAWDQVRVRVVERAPIDDGTVRVDFLAAFSNGGGEGPVYRIRLAPSGDGAWRVEEYGPELRRTVALLVAADRKARYGGLIPALTELQDSAAVIFRAWSRPLKFAPRDVEDPDEAARMLAELEVGIPAPLLRRELSRRSYASTSGLEWGVTDELAGDGAEVVWVRRPGGPDEGICAQRIGHRVPPGWSWLEERFPTCDGPAGRHVVRPRPLEVLEEIEAAGGVLRPGGVAPVGGGADQAP